MDKEPPLRRTLHVFSDASFDKAAQRAVTGYLLIDNLQSHAQDTEIVLQSFEEQNNIRAEMRGAIEALGVVMEKQREVKNAAVEIKFDVILYTDCESIVQLPTRQHRLATTEFLSRKTGKLLNNADLYQEFYKRYNSVQPTLQWIKGHTATSSRSQLHDYFRRVDIAVRKALRSPSRSE